MTDIWNIPSIQYSCLVSKLAEKTQKSIEEIDKTDQLMSIWAKSGTKEVNNTSKTIEGWIHQFKKYSILDSDCQRGWLPSNCSSKSWWGKVWASRMWVLSTE